MRLLRKVNKHKRDSIHIFFSYIFFCFVLLFPSSSPCRKDQFAVSYFSTSLIVLIQVYNWEIRHPSLVCCCGLDLILCILNFFFHRLVTNCTEPFFAHYNGAIYSNKQMLTLARFRRRSFHELACEAQTYFRSSLLSLRKIE